jgi:hypothetical protein
MTWQFLNDASDDKTSLKANNFLTKKCSGILQIVFIFKSQFCLEF